MVNRSHVLHFQQFAHTESLYHHLLLEVCSLVFFGLRCHGQLRSYVAIIFGKGATDSATALKCSSHLELKNGWKHGKRKALHQGKPIQPDKGKAVSTMSTKLVLCELEPCIFEQLSCTRRQGYDNHWRWLVCSLASGSLRSAM